MSSPHLPSPSPSSSSPSASKEVDISSAEFIGLIETCMWNGSYIVQGLPTGAPNVLKKHCSMAQQILDLLGHQHLRWRHSSRQKDNYISRLSNDLAIIHAHLTSLTPEELDGNLAKINYDVLRTGKRGRPRKHVDYGALQSIHQSGQPWRRIATVSQISRSTIYRRLEGEGIETSRRAYTQVSGDELARLIALIQHDHPFSGVVILQGHLLSIFQVWISLHHLRSAVKAVDPDGALRRWAGTVKRRIYHVKGAMSLWHHDGNEKLRPWGFYIHGCMDGYSRRMIFMKCRANKRAGTVLDIFVQALEELNEGYPARVRGDRGRENVGVEKLMEERWGKGRGAYLVGRSCHNQRIERVWRDVRRDTSELFRRIFVELEEHGLLHLDDPVERLALYVVFQPRIQRSLDETVGAWNHHKISTAHSQTPLAIFQLSKLQGTLEGWWRSNPGDEISTALDFGYGIDWESEARPLEEQLALEEEYTLPDEEWAQKVEMNTVSEIVRAKETLRADGFDWSSAHGSLGVEQYLCAVEVLRRCWAEESEDASVRDE